MISRFMALSSRAKVLIVMGILLLVFGTTGFLNSRADVDLTEAEAIEIARPYIDFEPEIEEGRIIRQGFSRRPIWAVLFAIPEPGGGRDDFLERTTVEIDAGDGEVIRVSTEGGNDG